MTAVAQKIAMWSGPRNLSTAMMYSFGNRADFDVVDEPFYAHYLAQTGLEHPMREAVLTSQPQDSEAVIQTLTKPKARHFYQKHMCQHMLDTVPRDWMFDVQNVFLIRHPARVISSFGAKYDGFGLADIGFSQQLELYDMLTAQGLTPIVIDSADIRANPEAMLRKLCEALRVAFDENMLNWPKGAHPSDGAWAPHWYNAVHNSTGFAGAEGPLPEVSAEMQPILKDALAVYDHLSKARI